MRIAYLVIAASVGVLLIGTCFGLLVPHIFLSMKESWSKRCVADVTAYACGIERYRAREGRLPAGMVLRQIDPVFRTVPTTVKIVITPTGYTVSETDGGASVWEVTDGRWTRYPSATTRDEWIRSSESQIAAARQLRHSS